MVTILSQWVIGFEQEITEQTEESDFVCFLRLLCYLLFKFSSCLTKIDLPRKLPRR